MALSKKVNSSLFTVHRLKRSVNRQLISSPREISSLITVNRKSAGFTLVELITGLAIGGFVLALVASIYLAHFRPFPNQNTAIDAATQNKLALDEIPNQIRQSQAIVSTCASCGGDTTGANILVLQIWPLDAGGDPIDPQGANYDYIEYRRDPATPTKLIRKTYPYATSSRKSGTRIVATGVSVLTFAYDNADPTLALEVTTGVTTAAIANGKTQTTVQSAKAILRNK